MEHKKTSHRRALRSRGTALAVLSLVFLAACASQRDGSDTPPVLQNGLTPTATPAVTTSCSIASANIVAQNLVNGNANVGQEVLWQVTGSGCSSYQLVRFGMAPFAFSDSTFFSTSYPFPATGLYEVVTVNALDASGNKVAEITATSSPFNVVATGPTLPPLSCAVGGPYNIDIPIDAYGNALVDAPVVTMPVTSNRATHLRSMVVLTGIAYAQSGVPDYTASGVHNPQVRVYGAGTNLVRFEVSDATNASIRTTCTGTVTLRGVYTAPATCSLIANRYSVSPGGSVVLTLRTNNGTAYAGTIDGVSVTPVNGGQRTVAFTSSRYVQASVTSAGGTTYCSAYVTVTQDVVGINYEDSSDWDYNDSVVCTSGYLQVSGKQIISHAFQSVLLSFSSRTACNHNVLVRVYDQAGTLRRSINYTSAAYNGSSLSVDLQPNWRIDSRFTPLGACAASGVSEQATSNRVAVGNYCNVTGN